MNISNTWTLPQDGFTVFYRFFRDKISWYEADAVCQFHHANLVTGNEFFFYFFIGCYMFSFLSIFIMAIFTYLSNTRKKYMKN